MEVVMKTNRALVAACMLWVVPVLLPAAEATERKVSVAGTAVTKVVPDIVVWRLTTTDLHEELLRAKAESDAKLKAILALRDGLGVAPEDVQTGYLAIHKEYERDRNGNRGAFKGFLVTRTVTYTQRDLKRFDEFLSKFTARAEVELGFSFDTTRRHELRTETRLKALAAAKKKAAEMTTALGAALGKVLTIEEEKPSRSFQTFASNLAAPDEGDRAPEDVASGTFAPGSIEIRVTVHASFAIE
jgi:hypothetical protein